MRPPLICPLLIALMLLAAFGRSGQADTVELRGGGHLTGQVERKQDVVIVTVDEDLQLAVPASSVARVVATDQLDQYRARAAAAGNDAQAHYELGIACVKENLVPGDPDFHKDFHMRRAIELDPNHEKARASLGYTRDRGRWILTAKLMRDRGMISVGGRSTLPEAAALAESADSANVESKRWIKEVTRLTKTLLKKTRSQRDLTKSQEAWQSLQSIEDPYAAAAIADQLRISREKGTQNRELRSLWVELLGRFKNSISVEALVRAGIDERDEVIRERALEKLQEFGAGSAVATYVPMLKSNDNRLVNRAAQALSWFPDPELALTYVDALVTKHKTVLAPSAGMSAGFSSDGGGGLSTGGKAKVKLETKQNPSVLGLLAEIEPDANFGYDQQAWRLHFASKRVAFSGDLRRDP